MRYFGTGHAEPPLDKTWALAFDASAPGEDSRAREERFAIFIVKFEAELYLERRLSGGSSKILKKGVQEAAQC